MPNVALNPLHSPKIIALENVIDGYPTESHTASNEVSSAPLENGANINDHVFRKPIELNMSASVSDLTEQGRDRVVNAWREIIKLNVEATIIRVYTEWASYPEMVITEAIATRQGSGMNLSLTLKEVIRVDVTATDNALLEENVAIDIADKTSPVERGLTEAVSESAEEVKERTRLQKFFDRAKEEIANIDNTVEDLAKTRILDKIGTALKKLPD